MTTEKFAVETDIGTLFVYASAPDTRGEEHVHVETGYGEGGAPNAVRVNGVEYQVSYTFDRNGRVSYVSNVRAGTDWKKRDHITESARGRIRTAAEAAFKTFIEQVGEQAFKDAKVRDIEYKLARVERQIAELQAERKELAAKLAAAKRARGTR
jgi:hypothetical protein